MMSFVELTTVLAASNKFLPVGLFSKKWIPSPPITAKIIHKTKHIPPIAVNLSSLVESPMNNTTMDIKIIIIPNTNKIFEIKYSAKIAAIKIAMITIVVSSLFLILIHASIKRFLH